MPHSLLNPWDPLSLLHLHIYTSANFLKIDTLHPRMTEMEMRWVGVFFLFKFWFFLFGKRIYLYVDTVLFKNFFEDESFVGTLKKLF